MARSDGHKSLAYHLLRNAAMIGCIVLILLGGLIFALGLLPSDLPSFFLRTGSHVFVTGAVGIPVILTRRWMRLRIVFRVVSGVVSLTLIAHITWLILDGQVLGFAARAAPMLLVLPACLNVIAAIADLALPGRPEQYRRWGYDVSSNTEDVCPECGA